MPLGQPQPPAAEQPNPYLPPGPQPLICEEWQGVNTATNRAGVDDKQCYWMDGVMPYERRRARVMPGIGPLLYTASGIFTIVMFKAANLGAIPLLIVILLDGSIVQIRTDTGATTTIGAAGTLLNPTQQTVQINQWGDQYVIIVSTQTNGYFVWDGTNLYEAGTAGPVVTLTSVGSGYKTTPALVVTGGHGSGVVLAAQIANGVVTGVSVINPGTGYLAGDTPSITFVGGTTSGSLGTLTAILTHNTGGSGASIVLTLAQTGGVIYHVASASVVNGGSGYSQFTALTVSGGAAPGGKYALIQAVLSPVIGGGIILSVSVVSGGQYASSPTPVVAVADAGGYYVSSVTINNAGSNYSPSVKVTAVGGGSAVAEAALSPLITGGTIASVAVVSGGLYGSNTAPTLTITDTAANASATMQIMPFAIQGNAVETYSGQAWVADGATYYVSAPGSVTDFATNDGGLNATANESYLKVGFTALLNTNGFLYFLGDSSVSSVSGVQTTGSVTPTTTYTFLNVDPEVGTSWPNTVLEWGNAPFLANIWGEHVLYGSQMRKISDPMDGVYNSVPGFTLTPSSAKAIVFNRKILCTLIPILDPVSKTQQNKLLIWDGKKWWASVQDVTLTYITTQEFNSNLTAWGTDGTHIYPLFQQPSQAFLKTIQTKLWDSPSYLFNKASTRFWGIALYNSTLSPNLTVNIDTVTQLSGTLTAGYTITGPASTGYFVIPPQAIGQQGVLMGMTIETMAADVEIVSIAIDDKIVGYRG